MIKISFQGNKLIIDGSATPIIFEWSHRSFFTIASGFNLDLQKQEYTFSDISTLHKTLQETIEYLTEEDFKFEVDNQTKTLLEKIDSDFREYQDALTSSKKIAEKQNINTLPIGFIRKLKKYQLRGYKHLMSVINGANFSVPGSGKTSVIYATFEKLREEKIVEKMLVIGPRSCFQPWEDEAKECIKEKLEITRLNGTKRYRQGLYINSDKTDIFLCSYQTIVNDQEEIINLCNKNKLFVVVDESHNIKSIDTGTRADAILEVSRYAIRRAILSGTPIPNSLLDLWSQMTFLWPSKQVLGDRSEYKFNYENEDNIQKIKKAVRPFIFRTTKAELGLPKQNFVYHYCDLKPYQKSIYKALSIKVLNDLKFEPEERITIRQWRKAKIVRLIQSASNPTLLSKYSLEFDVPPLSGEGLSVVELIEKYSKYETPTKIEAAKELVSNLINKNKKVILWSAFVFNIKTLQTILAEFEPLVVYGEIPKDEAEDIEFNREQQIRTFKESANAVVLIANPAACAESISLHKICHDAIYLDRTFNCGQYLQSLDRIHRIGLTSNEVVNYHLLIANNTVDETIDKRLKEKEVNMLRILEDDLPIGSFEVETQQLGQSEDEEKIDFDETIKDLEKRLTRSD